MWGLDGGGNEREVRKSWEGRREGGCPHIHAMHTHEEGEDGEARRLEVAQDDDVAVGAERLERLLGEQGRPLLRVLGPHLFVVEAVVVQCLSCVFD